MSSRRISVEFGDGEAGLSCDMDKDKPINKVCHATFEIYTRLFDHRPFLNGEIQQFMRQFECKRGNKDIESLLKSRDKLIDLQDSLNTFDGNSTRASLTNFLDSVQKTTAALEGVCDKEEIQHLDTEANKEQQKKCWQKFLEENTQKISSFDNYFKDQELKLRKHYEQLEETLRQGF